MTRKSVLFIIYQTGRHVPRDGFGVALVMEGTRVGNAREKLKSVVEQDAEEFVVVEP